MLDAVERYNLFSGGGAMPPTIGGLGVQYRGYTKYGAAETLALAARIREAHMPCDVWGVEPGWQAKRFIHVRLSGTQTVLLTRTAFSKKWAQ